MSAMTPIQREAALTICGSATDVTDAAFLLEICGLLPYAGHDGPARGDHNAKPATRTPSDWATTDVDAFIARPNRLGRQW